MVIPHYGGGVLFGCLEALDACRPRPERVIVVDDASTDDTAVQARRRFAGLIVLRNERNLGFAESSNRGIAAARTEFVALLNNDTEVAPDWLAHALAVARAHPKAAAIQPKVLSLRDRSRFDYAGGAGGLMDRFGYPFALGRLFEHCEVDRGQYDRPRPIFWASGAAALFRRDALEAVGPLDESFFMHQEEIDVCWRLRLAGYEVWSAPAAVVYHYEGFSLRRGSFRKAYYNHRNSLRTLIHNYGLGALCARLPVRLALELATIVVSALRLDLGRAAAALAGLVWCAAHPRALWRGRRRAQSIRTVDDREALRATFPGSIVFEYFIKRTRRASSLAALAPCDDGGTRTLPSV